MAEFTGEFLKTKDMSIEEFIPGGMLKIREPSRRVVMAIKKEGKGEEEAATDAFIKHAPGIVISHNVEKNGVPMDKQELLNQLFESLNFTTRYVEEVMAFFPSKKESKSS